MSATTSGLGCWTILDESTDAVRATVTADGDDYWVRDSGGQTIGHFPTVHQAIESIRG